MKLTELAKNKYLEILKESNKDTSNYIRVSVKSGGCSGLKYNIDYDKSFNDDDILIDEDIKMISDKSSYALLESVTLDYSGGLNGKGFIFNNPSATRTCGCGESFSF